ncbi:unnamed protein product [Camellia sinensis]
MTLSTESSPSSLVWKFSQVFGERSPGEDVQDADIISSIEFEKSGDYLAVGDRGGRIVIFERKANKDSLGEHHTHLEKLDFVDTHHPEFQYKTEFQSHEPEFDYLKSLEIEEKINKVRWCATPNGSLFILSTNDKTIKLWKVKEHKVKKVKEMDFNPFVCPENALLAASYVSGQHKPSFGNGYFLEWTEKMTNNTSPSHEGDTEVANIGDGAPARCRKVYGHAHDFNINSISNNSDGETFISADDLRINLWNLEVSDQCFNIVDMKPSNMEDLTAFGRSPFRRSYLCSFENDFPGSQETISMKDVSSRGFIRLVDMRQSALCDHSARIFRDGESRGSKSFFTEIIASISDIKFSTDGRHILSRDYMNLKVGLWDMHMETSPVAIFKIHEHLRPKISWRNQQLRLLGVKCPNSVIAKLNFVELRYEVQGAGPLVLSKCTKGAPSTCLNRIVFHVVFKGYVICITMTQYLINLIAASVEMDFILQLDLIATYCVFFPMELEVKKESQWKLAKIRAVKPHLQAASRARRSSLSNLTRAFYRQAREG